ncbi:TetR family transcriptional regulator [Cohnella sp. AR92]|nr:TetR family transcriptional regulator [Cohnella sp. AR92]
MNSYIKLLNQKPFSAITVNDICEEALVHRSTFYRYYVDKYNLFNQLMEIIGNNLYERGHVRSLTHSLPEVLIEYVNDNRSLFLNVTADNQNNELYSLLIRIASKLLMEGAQMMDDPLSIKIRRSPYPNVVCEFYSSGMIEVLKQWVMKKYDFSKEEIIEIVTELTA